VINVARKEPRKGERVWLDSFTGVMEAHPDALLIIVGRRRSAELDAHVAELALPGVVPRLRICTDVADLLTAANELGFPSLYEGLGGVAVDALGLGPPIVASDVSALRELVGDDRGRIVPPGDPEALSARDLESLAGGAEVHRRRRLARQWFDRADELERCLDGMTTFFEEIETQLAPTDERNVRRLRLHLDSDLHRTR
jgi:glycosyltransferase involved in cell wall biosynthesis